MAKVRQYFRLKRIKFIKYLYERFGGSNVWCDVIPYAKDGEYSKTRIHVQGDTTRIMFPCGYNKYKKWINSKELYIFKT